MTAPAQQRRREVPSPSVGRRPSAVALYDEGLRAVTAGRTHPVQLCDEAGRCHPLPLHAWCAESLPGDRALLDRCAGTTLDVGCGPGRLTAALAARSVPALGIDISATAVALTRRRGGTAIRASVFGPLPAETRWDSVLLADGNIGIGGDPRALLRRCRALLAPGGRIVLELDPASATGARRVHLCIHGRRSEYFDWAQVGPEAIADLATDSSLTCQDIAVEEERWISVLTRR